MCCWCNCRNRAIEPLVTTLQSDFKEEFVSARSYRATDDEVGRDFDRAENYLSLVGLVIVILGGIAVSSVTRVFVLQKMRSIAVLKCLGARSAQIIAVYMLQVMTLGLAGSLLGVVLARLAVAAHSVCSLTPSSSSLLADVQYGVTGAPRRRGSASACWCRCCFRSCRCCTCALVKPSLLLRDETTTTGRDWTRIGAMVLVSAALVALTSWQASSLRVGLIVCAGFSALAVVLQLTGRLLVRVVAPLANAPSFPLRHAVLHISRPGNQTRVILLAVGLGRLLHRRRPLAAGESAARSFRSNRRPTARTCS